MKPSVPDIHPTSAIAALDRDGVHRTAGNFPPDLVAALCGMSRTYVRRALGKPGHVLSVKDVLFLLDLDAFAETFVPRSRIAEYLAEHKTTHSPTLSSSGDHQLIRGSAPDLIPRLRGGSVNCVVTSTPYWGTRLYLEPHDVLWADGERCPFGHEQTPEGFLRHTIEVLYLLKPALAVDGSIWWNLMDTYNTRTQIRSNAAETLRAMQGLDPRSWKDYECRRYSAGHSFLKDGELCMIPSRVAERASRIGYWVKSIITWKKIGSMPETVGSRVTREAEFILHLSKIRTPYFDKGVYNQVATERGGRNRLYEGDKVTDIWCLPTTAGQNGHGAQFPIGLPARCIALSTREGDLVLDPFVGAGTTSIAAAISNRRSLGFEVSEDYLQVAKRSLENVIKKRQLKLL